MFYLELDCLSPGVAVVEVTASSETQKELRWFLQKKCGRGSRGDLTTTVNGLAASRNGKTLSRWTAPYVHFSGSVNVTLSVAQGNQRVRDVVVTSPVPTTLRGMGAKGGFIEAPYSFIVTSSCPTTANVTVVVYIPPYSNIILRWMHECNGTQSEAFDLPIINVGTKPQLSDIVHSGTTLAPYDKGIEVNESTYTTHFFVSGEVPGQVHLTADM